MPYTITVHTTYAQLLCTASYTSAVWGGGGGRDDGFGGVLEDDGGAEADDLAAAAEAVEEEGLEVFDVLDGDVDDEVVAACEDEDGEDLGEGDHGVVEVVDDAAGEWADLDGDQGLDVAAEGGEVDLGGEAGDDTAFAEEADAFEAG